MAFQLAFSEKKYIHNCRVFWIFVYLRVFRFAFLSIFISVFAYSLLNLDYLLKKSSFLYIFFRMINVQAMCGLKVYGV